MASLYADVGKDSADLLKKVFPEKDNKFETEVNTKAACGGKLQIVANRNQDGSVSGVYKPSFDFLVAENVKGEWKAEFSTENKSKVDLSLSPGSVSGLKVKFGGNDTAVNAGADYKAQNFSSNFKLDYPLRGGKAPSLDAGAVFLHGKYCFGAKFLYSVGADVPEIEAKIGSDSGRNSVTLSGKRAGSGALSFSTHYFKKINDDRTVAARLNFAPGASSFLAGSSLCVATSNKINADTTVKARFDSSTSRVGFGVVQVLNPNLKVEFGTHFPASLAAGSVYSFRLIYDN